MNRQQFSEFVKNPAVVNAGTLKMLEDLVKRYPYCQTGQILYTYNLFREEQLQYHNQLKKAAAYAGDRRKLKELIDAGKGMLAQVPVVIKPAEEEPVIVSVEPVTLVPVAETIVFEPEPDESGAITSAELDSLPELQVKTESPDQTPKSQLLSAMDEPVVSADRMTRDELLAVVRRRLAEINAEKTATPPQSAPAIEINPDVPPSIYLTSTPSPSKEAIIEKFIREEPKITRPKTAFFSPADTALRSNLDEEEIVSETLAMIYAKQGNIQKAIHIYEKLSLLNQEKSRYFAAQIQQLRD